ncbi:hypothetical protein OA85_16620 [Flavobacterium sp. AED]|nr:hypothetical protein OA85_16620 [Flavobacterium sp. AED]
MIIVILLDLNQEKYKLLFFVKVENISVYINPCFKLIEMICKIIFQIFNYRIDSPIFAPPTQ